MKIFDRDANGAIITKHPRIHLQLQRLLNIVLIGIIAALTLQNAQNKHEIDKVLQEQTECMLRLDSIQSELDLTVQDWDLFIEAIIEKESSNNDLAIGAKNDVGCLQLTPIYVQECNCILGYDKYSLEDRFNRQKSIEMFNVMNSRYNPNKDFHMALKLHNPQAPISYHRQVLAIYERKRNERLTK